MQKLFVLLLTAGLLIAFSVSPSPSANFAETSVSSDSKGESHLLEVGRAPKTRAATPPSANIKVVSYNIRWRGGDDLRELAELLKEDPEIGGAAILGLQEVDRNKKRTGNKNTAETLAEDLGMYYAWAAPPVPKTGEEEETGVAILSNYPLSDARRLVLPHKGPGGRRRVALGATLKVGRVDVRVYSVHSENRMKVDRKLEQSKAVIDDLAHYDKDMPAIVLGDLNTWEPAAVTKTFKLFSTQGFQTPFSREHTFFRRVVFLPIKLKLDWIWLRNLEATSSGIDRTIKLSDHWPLWVSLRLPDAPVSER